MGPTELGVKTMNRNTYEMINRLRALGITYDDAMALRRISMTLHRWHELECGTDSGAIERDEKTGQPYWYNANARYLDPRDPRARLPIPDRETGAKKRLAAIMAKYPSLQAYVQGDPRGASLYILRPGDVPEGSDIDAYYNRGIAVYK
jgi:hypothetical protein